MLTNCQETILEEFLTAVENKQNLFKDSEPRQIGKTYLLNKLGFFLQVLGYSPYILTPYLDYADYFVDGFISLNNIQGFRGLRLNKNTVVIGDEARLYMMDDLIDYCEYRQIPIVGYFNFNRPRSTYNVNKFKQEYQCVWVEKGE